MSDVPQDIYLKVLEISTSLTNASEAEDEILMEFHYQQLLEFFNEQEISGNSHPFITETVADFTEDAANAVQYYKLSLEQCRTNPSEPTHTKHISLAERLIELNQIGPAKNHLLQGRSGAMQRNDSFWVNQADELLASIPL